MWALPGNPGQDVGVLVRKAGEQHVAQGFARAMTRGSPKCSAGVLLVDGGARDPFTFNGWTRKDGHWPVCSASGTRLLAARALAWSSYRLGRRALQPRWWRALMTVSIRIAQLSPASGDRRVADCDLASAAACPKPRTRPLKTSDPAFNL